MLDLRMRIAELLDQVEEWAPWGKAAEWDPVGLQLGDPEVTVSSVAVCHEITDEAVDRLVDAPPSLVVTYHPLLFRPTDRLVAGPGPTGRVLRLLQAGVAVAVVHTNFDAAAGGTAEALAVALGLTDIRPFGFERTPASVKVVTFLPPAAVGPVRDAMARSGGGVIGNYTHCSFGTTGTGTFFAGEGTDPVAGEVGNLNEEPEVRLEMIAPAEGTSAVLAALLAAHPYEEPAFDVYEVESRGFFGRVGTSADLTSLASLTDRVVEVLSPTTVRSTGRPGALISEVAVVPGSGSGYIPEAHRVGADALVTGDVSHHAAVGALDRGLAVIDPGHVATERPGVRKLLANLRELIPDVRDLTGLIVDPWSR